jgi:hypothetical protein
MPECALTNFAKARGRKFRFGRNHDAATPAGKILPIGEFFAAAGGKICRKLLKKPASRSDGTGF